MKTRSQIATAYIEARFPEAGNYYKNQWRDRFDRGEEWSFSDFGGRRVLQKLDPNWYPADETACKVLPPYPAL